jgi:hypothetical protein
MKTRSIIFIIFIAWSIGLYAESDYYYWYRGEKVPLELLPTKKFILVTSPDDTTALKKRLAHRDIMAHPFRIEQITYAQDAPDKIDCWAIVESINLLPDLTDDEAILYEGQFFLNADKLEVGGLSHTLLVKLKQIEDLPLLEELAEENGVKIDGQPFSTMPLWYSLSCTKTSKGNAMQMANMFYETTTLFDSSTPGFSNEGSDATLGIDNLQEDRMIYAANGMIYINMPETETIRIYSLTGSLLYEATKPAGKTQIPLKGNESKILIIRGGYGWAKKIIIQ